MNYRKLFVIIAISFVFIAAKQDKPKAFTFKKFEKSLSKIDSNLYASKYEVNNFLYRTFLNEIKQEGKTQEYHTANIDSLNWRTPLAYMEPYVELYHIHVAYNNYPVVNISHQGAKLFCSWLTKKYNNHSKRKYKKVKFRLPTQAEWEKAARGNLTGTIYPWGGYSIQTHKGVMCNFSHIGAESIHYDKETAKFVIMKDGGSSYFMYSDNSDVTSPVDIYPPNSFGIYNICGNVKEMVQKEGITRGGGWLSPGYDVRIASKDTYIKSATDIGFRYFMEIIEK